MYFNKLRMWVQNWSRFYSNLSRYLIYYSQILWDRWVLRVILQDRMNWFTHFIVYICNLNLMFNVLIVFLLFQMPTPSPHKSKSFFISLKQFYCKHRNGTVPIYQAMGKCTSPERYDRKSYFRYFHTERIWKNTSTRTTV